MKRTKIKDQIDEDSEWRKLEAECQRQVDDMILDDEDEIVREASDIINLVDDTEGEGASHQIPSNRPPRIPAGQIRELADSFLQFPLLGPVSMNPPMRHRARVIDFYGISRVPGQLRDWLRATGAEVRDNIRTGQVDGSACGFIAAEAVALHHDMQEPILQVSDEVIAGLNTRGVVVNRRRFLNLTATDPRWLNGLEVMNLAADRMMMDTAIVNRDLLSVGTTQEFIDDNFARHALQFRETGGTRLVIILLTIATSTCTVSVLAGTTC